MPSLNNLSLSSISTFSKQKRIDLYNVLLNQITNNAMIIQDYNNVNQIELLLILVYDDLNNNDLDLLTKVIPILSWIMSCVWIIEDSSSKHSNNNNNINNNVENICMTLINSNKLIECIKIIIEIFEKQCRFFKDNITSLDELNFSNNETQIKLLIGILFLIANQSLPNMINIYINRISKSIDIVINKVININENSETTLYIESINNVSFNIFWLLNTIVKQNQNSRVFPSNIVNYENIKKSIYIISLYLSNKTNQKHKLQFDINQEHQNEKNTLQVINLIKDYFNYISRFQSSDNDISTLYQIYNDLLENVKSYTISLITTLNSIS
jgi:hypothetical protein